MNKPFVARTFNTGVFNPRIDIKEVETLDDMEKLKAHIWGCQTREENEQEFAEIERGIGG